MSSENRSLFPSPATPKPLVAMNPRILLLLPCFAWLVALPCHSERIRFFSAADQVNLTSTGEPMGDDFVFELGVFADGFIPTDQNTAEWAARWLAAKDAAGNNARVTYNSGHNRLDAEFLVTNNQAPFAQGTPGYLWGFRTSGKGTEWILLRKDVWAWPTPNTLNPLPPEWNVAEATAIVGQVNPGGIPFLMKSAAVSGSAPPPTDWPQWQNQYLAAGAPRNPGDDPDGDGTTNLLEYIFDMRPDVAEPPPSMPLDWVQIAGQRFLTVSIPRNGWRHATLEVEVSSDLRRWNSGPSHTATIAESPEEWIVRDLSPVSPVTPMRFLRLKASVP